MSNTNGKEFYLLEHGYRICDNAYELDDDYFSRVESEYAKKLESLLIANRKTSKRKIYNCKRLEIIINERL